MGLTIGERWRADEMAERAGITTVLLRSYQSKGLLPPPEREGRIAWYRPLHEARLGEIQRLKARGYSLRAIADLAATPGGLVDAVESSPSTRSGTPGASADQMDKEAGAITIRPGEPAAHHRANGEHQGEAANAARPLTLAQVAREANVPAALVRSMERSRLLRPFQVDGEWVYHPADVTFVRRVLSLLAGGLALDEFLALAEPLLDMVDELAQKVAGEWHAVVLDRLRAGHLPKRQQADVLAWSLREMAETVGQLVAYNLERAVIIDVQAELDTEGTSSERKALARALRGQARRSGSGRSGPSRSGSEPS